MKYFSYIFLILIFFDLQTVATQLVAAQSKHTLTKSDIKNLTPDQKKELVDFFKEKYKTIENESDKEEIKKLLDFIESNSSISNFSKIKNAIKYALTHTITKAAISLISIIAIIYEIKKIKNKKADKLLNSNKISKSYEQVTREIFDEKADPCLCLSDMKYLKEFRREYPNAKCYTYNVDGTPVIVSN
ncbi:hypothetical protein KJ644_04780 [Candidatus Dependentiae bacterium]|nr:hypothetical protein [Candidatus Dependentiae bacterium]MBU4387749.1 hypothetical protein [Candidatus Dependentiae bacterium]MCG2756341.1 hypothetical protein [Candidatus Dependentiae bacterium]